MNNTELFERFSQIAQSNPFDAVVELKGFRKEYRTSEFYKTTRTPLKKAYKMFVAANMANVLNKVYGLLDVKALGKKISNLFLEVDEDALGHLLETVKTQFNLDSLNTETGEIKDLIESLKILNK